MGFFSKTDALDEQLSFKSAAPIEELLDIPVDEVIEDEVEEEQEPEGTRFDIETFWDDGWKAKVFYYTNGNRVQYEHLPSSIEGDGSSGNFSSGRRLITFLYAANSREQAEQHIKSWLAAKVEASRKKEILKAQGEPQIKTIYL